MTKQSPLYVTWARMLGRCRNPNNTKYPQYGGRGISVCERWHTFVSFAEDMGPKPDGMSLDRIDVNGNYEPGNCRWATDQEQQRNKNNNRLLTLDGQTKCVTEWAELCGLKESTIRERLRKGWDAKDVLKPVLYRNGRKPKLTPEQAAEIRSSPEPETVLADRFGVNRAEIGRIKRGESYRG